MKTLRGIIQSFGGSVELSNALGGTPKQNAITFWYKGGIPERYWHVLIKAGIADVEELHFLNELARKGIIDEPGIEAALRKEIEDPEPGSYFSLKGNLPKRYGIYQ